MQSSRHPCRYVALAGLLLPIIAWIVLLSIPDLVTRVGPAGTFLTAEATPCGYGCDTVTSVHTTAGTFLVAGVYASALRGQAMVLRDSTGAGLQLCVDGTPAACARLATEYAGELRTVGKAPLGIGYGLRASAIEIGGYWFVVGLVALIVCGIRQMDAEEARQREAKRTKP